MAVKIARYFTGRRRILAFDGAYHGRTHMTMSLTSKAHPYKTGFGPFSNDVVHAPVPTSPHDDSSAVEVCLDRIRATLIENDPASFAAMIIEPILGEAGCLIPQPGFLAGLRVLALTNGVYENVIRLLPPIVIEQALFRDARR